MIPETPTLQRKVSSGEERYTNLIKNEFVKHAKEINKLGKMLEGFDVSGFQNYYTKDEVEDLIERELQNYNPTLQNPVKTSELINDSGFISEVLWEDILNRPNKFTPSSHTHKWGDISNKPSTYPPSTHEHPEYLTEVTWSDIQDKPSKFPPTSHTHTSNSINKMTGYYKLLQTSDIDENDTLNVAIGKLESKFDDYLPLSGGTMTGSIMFTGLNDRRAGIDLNNDGKNFDIGWNWTNRDGAGFYLRSTDFATTTGGGFGAYARNATNSYDLFGNPNGSLTWNGTSFTVGGGTGTISGNITNNKLTGYTKPSSTSALAATDTLNGALGKLERALDNKLEASHDHDEKYPIINRSGMINIVSNTDLDTLTTAGTYYTTSGNGGSTVHQTLSHSPTNGDGGGFMMYVIAQGSDSNAYPKQIIYMYNGDIYERTRGTSSVWGDWHKRAYTDSDITGNAATATLATNANALNNYFESRPTSANTCYADGKLRTYLATTTMTTGKPPSDAHILHLAWDNGKWDGQIALSTSGGNLYWRTQDNSNDWGAWQTAAKSGHTHNYAGSSSAGGAATSVAIEAGSTNSDRYVWFSWSGEGNEGRPVYDANFKYNPSTNNLTVTKINGVTVGSDPKFTDTVYTHPTTAGNKHIPSGGSSGQILKYSASGTAVWADEYSYTHPTTAGNKHIPSGGASGNVLVYSSAGTAAWGAVPSHSHSNFVKSGSTAAAGLVPKPSTTAGTTKYLCEDGTWKEPPNDNTDTNVTSIATSPSSEATWYPINTTSSSTATGTTVKNPDIRYWIKTGTASAGGYAVLGLGNATAVGTAGNTTGRVRLYGSAGKYADLFPHTDDTANRSIYLPKSGGTLVCHTTDTAIGSASTPVYVSASGVATACTSLDATKLSGTIPTDCYTNTTYSAGTAALLTAGANTSNRVWTAKILADYVKGSLSAAENGYVELPNGLIINWGKYTHSSTTTAANQTVTFSKAYSTACYSVVFGIGGNRMTTNFSMSWIQATAITKTNFTIGSVSSNYPQYWMAIGK